MPHPPKHTLEQRTKANNIPNSVNSILEMIMTPIIEKQLQEQDLTELDAWLAQDSSDAS